MRTLPNYGCCGRAWHLAGRLASMPSSDLLSEACCLAPNRAGAPDGQWDYITEACGLFGEVRRQQLSSVEPAPFYSSPQVSLIVSKTFRRSSSFGCCSRDAFASASEQQTITACCPWSSPETAVMGKIGAIRVRLLPRRAPVDAVTLERRGSDDGPITLDRRR